MNVDDGLDAINRGDFDAALEIWTTLAEQGNMRAQFNLGVFYNLGEGVEREPEEAVRWFLQAPTVAMPARNLISPKHTEKATG